MKKYVLPALSAAFVLGLACCAADDEAAPRAGAPDAAAPLAPPANPPPAPPASPPPAVDGGDTPRLDPLTCEQKVATPVDAIFSYTTTGGWVLTLNGHQLVMRNPADTDKVESWGGGPDLDPHENLNGKHIKDWTSDRRTFVLPDDTVVTLRTCPGYGTAFVSIYDGEHTRRVAAQSNKVLFSSDDPAERIALEAAEADGETARLFTNAASGLSYENVHQQDVGSDTRPLDKVPAVQLLGESGGPANPNNVRDFYDDPRLGHT